MPSNNMEWESLQHDLKKRSSIACLEGRPSKKIKHGSIAHVAAVFQGSIKKKGKFNVSLTNGVTIQPNSVHFIASEQSSQTSRS